tara:strand:+ start:499 stop:1299 length:801 start_codon:yes stop_codon:yes gene_type:complete
MQKELIKLANHLDRIGLVKEANYLDNIIKKASSIPDNVMAVIKAILKEAIRNQRSNRQEEYNDHNYQGKHLEEGMYSAESDRYWYNKDKETSERMLVEGFTGLLFYNRDFNKLEYKYRDVLNSFEGMGEAASILKYFPLLYNSDKSEEELVERMSLVVAFAFNKALGSDLNFMKFLSDNDLTPDSNEGSEYIGFRDDLHQEEFDPFGNSEPITFQEEPITFQEEPISEPEIIEEPKVKKVKKRPKLKRKKKSPSGIFGRRPPRRKR